jgi:hypothetical protein
MSILLNQENPSHKRAAGLCLGAWLAVSAALFLPTCSFAQIVNLTSINTSSSAGMNSWTVNGQNQLNQQWFWYQTDGGIAQPVNTISAPTITTYNGASGINEVTAVYQNSQISVSIDYFLTGGGVGSGNADISESIMAVNKSSSSMNLNFYQYSNFNLLGGASHDTVQIFGSPGAYNFIRQANGATGIQEAVTAPSANFAEAADVGLTLNRLNTVAGLTLNDNLTAGPGDETWAFQWNQLLAANGGEFDLTKDKSLSIQVIPEPSTMALICFGAGALGLALRRKTA